MIYTDFKCFDCDKTFEVPKKSIKDDFVCDRCEFCGSENVKRIFSPIDFQCNWKN